jgi:hypothetical protein
MVKLNELFVETEESNSDTKIKDRNEQHSAQFVKDAEMHCCFAGCGAN